MAEEKDTSRRRRLLVRVAIVVGVLLVVIGVPLVLTTQPWFYSRSTALSEKYEPWRTSAHAEVRCEECHVPPSLLARTVNSARMTGEFYYSLLSPSRVPGEFARPSNEACLECHNDLRSVSPRGDLQIPHRAHVNVLKMDCVACHNYLVHERNSSGNHLPAMEDCLKCHDGDTAKATCTACHTRKAAPDNHQASDWLIVHPKEAAGPECDSCHKWTDDWCADCHALRPESHGDDWRAVHGEQVKQRRNCEACHDGAFCVRCHGLVPQENFNPDLKRAE